MSGSAGHHLKPRTMLRISILIVLPMLHASVIATEEDFRCKEPFSKCVTSTKVFTMKVEPMLFNEDFSERNPDRYSYRPSLLGSPDLPPWMQYIYSKSHHAGFIYGTPPSYQSDFTLEIVAMDYEDYNTTTKIIKFIVLPRRELARHQVHLKIDNLAVEDLFDSQYLDDLLGVFRFELWPEAIHDLHVTFFASAVHLGARLPLRPEEKEGVVIHLGSAANVSESLHRLQNEVRPLYKLSKLASCPRDFKRTTVDRLFRQLNFEMDWCAFRLTIDSDHNKEEDNTLTINHHMHRHHFKPLHSLDLPIWRSPSQWEAPERSYVHEFLLSILIPMLVMILLAILLSLILCFHHEGMDDGSSEYFDSIFDVCEDLWGNKRNQETPAIQMVRYAAVQRATSTLRSLSAQRDPSPALSRLAPEKENVFRPQPPPYCSGTRNSGVDF